MLSQVRGKDNESFVKESLDDDVGSKLEALEQQMQFFRQVTEEAIKRSGIDSKELEGNVQTPPKEFAGKDRRIIERAKNLKAELKSLEKEYDDKVVFFKMHAKKQKTAGKKRKKKFKRLGGQGWMPM